MNSTAFDLVVYGASGFTGRLVAEHLLSAYGAEGPVRWALAGRSAEKLEAARSLIGAPSSLPMLIADGDDAAALGQMAAQTRVVLSTAGPYQLYGSALVVACAAAGCDYVDLTGESHWIAAMIGAHEAQAKASGSRLVFSCGFDSIPFDLGVYFVQEAAKARWGDYAKRVRGRVRAMRGGLSGGTLASGQASMAAAAKDPAVGTLLADPFALTPGFVGSTQPDGQTPYEDPLCGAWVGPFMMAPINVKAVHRTNFLKGHLWGEDFAYDEMVMLQGPPQAGDAGLGGFEFASGALPKPGEGPSKAERDTGFYELLFIAEGEDGHTLRAVVKGDRDPGYGSTSKIIAEAALALIEDTPQGETPGGCWTPAAAMAPALLRRLPQRAGLTFALED
jgi:short subunit dehydrogenase-like uncharacterized protein